MKNTNPFTALAFFAHPDDEVMLAGGTLALLAEAGAHIHFICATRGEGGEVGEPPLSSRKGLGDLREQEMVCAVQPLGAKSLTFLGYVDPTVGDDDKLFPFTEDLTMLAGQITASIKQVNADVVISHGADGEYGHPAHVVCYQASLAAVLSLGEEAPVLYAPMAIYPEHPKPRLANKSQLADYILDIKSVLAKKEASALCHKTQHALFVRRTTNELGRLVNVEEVLMQEESLKRVYPGKIDKDPIYELLKPAGNIKEYKEAK